MAKLSTNLRIASPPTALAKELARLLARELEVEVTVVPEAVGDDVIQLDSQLVRIAKGELKLPLKFAALLQLLMREETAEGNQLALGEIIFDKQKQKLIGADEVELTQKEGELLFALYAGGEEGVAKDWLLKTLWGIEAEIDTHTLETHIYRLRAKLKMVTEAVQILAVPNGYRLQL